MKDGKLNAQTCNTVFQVTSEPARVVVGLNKRNLTHDLVAATGVLAVTVLGRWNMALVKRFGFASGRTVDKFAGMRQGEGVTDYFLGKVTGCPILNAGLAYIECRVVAGMALDVGTHTLFVADVLGGDRLRFRDPITYDYYRQNRGGPEADVDDVDYQNVVAALNLEYGSNRRYRYQIDALAFPRVTAALEGVMRTEGDHIDHALDYLEHREAGRAAQPAMPRSRRCSATSPARRWVT